LPLTLTGVVVDTTARTRSVALVRCATSGAGRATLYGVGDRACGVAEVRDILDEAIVVRDLATGRLERVALAPGGTAPRLLASVAPPEPPPAREPAPTVAAQPTDVITVTLTRTELERYWGDLPSLLTSVQATPHYQVSIGGQRSIDGFTIASTGSGTLVTRMGLQTGDVVHDVNGDRLDNAGAAMRLLAVARDMSQARVRITRNGQPLTVAITVE
jgi:type II secretory pathway component PulC